jgi:ribonuclease BN (tRNA processing enzyme)
VEANMTRARSPEILPFDPDLLVATLLRQARRALLLGPSGSGKSTLATALATRLGALGRTVRCLAADPGSPAFGVPGSLSLGEWRDGAWSAQQLEALCTLDAARFRLPLTSAAGTLARAVETGTLLIDAPGVVRGVAGAELVESLVRATNTDLILVLNRPDRPLTLGDELEELGVELAWIRADDQARRPGSHTRARRRTRLWDLYLKGGAVHRVPLDALTLLGTPPRRAPEAWQGKQVAFLDRGRAPVLGEVLGLEDDTLRVLLPRRGQASATLLVRDACRGNDGLLATSKPFAADLVHYVPPPDVLADGLPEADTGPRAVVQVGAAVACLINGVFGDPLLHLRLRHQRRSLLFDLGDGARLPARIAHQVTDVFVTHAHADHIGGFLWLLRSRIGEDGVCRLYGPPGLAGHIQGFIAGILWDRIGDRGPVFEVAELHDGCLRLVGLQAGRPQAIPLGERVVKDSVLLDEPGFQVRCAVLDHGTPVLAFAFELATQVKIRPERLAERGLAPGPWLTGLKQRILAGDFTAGVELPDGSQETVAELAADLTLSGEGGRLVYATDFADTPENRRRLAALANGAHCLLCEASFLMRDRGQAERTGHLTTRACGEIAAAAGVRLLIPFHFSRRYQHEPREVYDEIAAACPQVVVPKQGLMGPTGT